MKLIYQIPGKLWYIHDFLDYPNYKKLHCDTFKSKLINFHSSQNLWGESLQHGHSDFVKRSDLIANYEPLQKIKFLLENNPFHKVKIKNYRPILHSMGNGSGINWHSDFGLTYGITYYLNNRWNKKFGGEFLFATDNSFGFLPIIGNSLVIVKVPLEHKVAPVLKPLIPRKTIQIFVDKY